MEVGHHMFFKIFKLVSVITANCPLQKSTVYLDSYQLNKRPLRAVANNKLPKFAAKNAAGTNTHWAKPNNVRICPLAKRYVAIRDRV
jgi:hypothetical protein